MQLFVLKINTPYFYKYSKGLTLYKDHVLASVRIARSRIICSTIITLRYADKNSSL